MPLGSLFFVFCIAAFILAAFAGHYFFGLQFLCYNHVVPGASGSIHLQKDYKGQMYLFTRRCLCDIKHKTPQCSGGLVAGNYSHGNIGFWQCEPINSPLPYPFACTYLITSVIVGTVTVLISPLSSLTDTYLLQYFSGI